MPPVEVAAILVVAALYALRVRRSPGLVAGWRQASFAGGIAVLLVAVCSPLGGVAQQGLLSAHMLQHTLIGAVAPLLLLLGMPRAFLEPLLSPAWRRRLERVQHPVVAFPLWVVGTIVWLLPAVHHQVLESPPLWILQQASFLALGLVLWAPVVESLPAPHWFSTGLEVRLHGRRLGRRPLDRQRLLVLGDALLRLARRRRGCLGLRARSRTRPTPGP